MKQHVPAPPTFTSLDPHKFREPERTATGARRASVALQRLETLWFNTGTLCNIECAFQGRDAAASIRRVEVYTEVQG